MGTAARLSAKIAGELIAVEGVGERAARRVDSGPAGRHKRASMLRDDLLFRVARSLLDFPQTTAPAEALALIGPAFDADRAWLIRIDERRQTFAVAYEWCADGVPACLPDLPDVPAALIAHPMRDFLRGRPVVLADIEDLPPDAQSLKEEMRREGNRATAATPLFRDGRLVALIGLDDTRKVHAWTKTEMMDLGRLGELVLAAADRPREEPATSAPASPSPPETGGCFVRAGNCHVRVNWDEIVAIVADGDHSRLRLAGGREFFELKALSVWTAMLPSDLFGRVHRSHIVGWKHVRRLRRSSGGRWVIELDGGNLPPVPVGRHYQPAVRNHINLRPVRARR